ncbi:MAG: RNA pyrophosphohydrolase [Holosporaceae bacterium]|jgi:putative (di)nucleoside polyphosphate hydrolase|nr:RNA pyrophosphohydrolase [Holosporaceae bacterium]
MALYRKCAAIFLLKDSKIFVGRRIDSKNAWQVPQGGVEEGETFLDAAKRELFEETNISSIEILGLSSMYRYDFPPHIAQALQKRHGKQKYAGQEVGFAAFKFVGDEKEINVRKTPQEFADWKWTTVKELLENIIYFKKKPYEQAIAEFQKFEWFPI